MVTIRQNETRRFTGTWTDPNDNPINLTGYTGAYSLTHQTRDTTHTQTTGITMGGTLGTVAVVVTDEATALLPVGEYVERLDVISSGGERTCLMRQSVEVVPA